MKNLAFFILAIFFAAKVSAQTEPANYKTAISKFTQIYNSDTPDSISSMYSPEIKAGMPKNIITQAKIQTGNLNKTEFIQYGNGAPMASYKASFQNADLILTIALNNENQIIGWHLLPIQNNSASVIPDDPSLTELLITLKTLSGSIAGTLTMPKAAVGKIPVVLIIAGSGQTDRNGNGPGLNTNIYKLLAYALGKNGIASLRYDKRMIGESISKNKESELTIDDYVDDAVNLINMLNDDPRFSKVIVAGHSEGSLVGMMASIDEPAKAYISIAGAGQPAEKILTEQMKSEPPYIANEFKAILDSLRKGKFTQNVDPALYSIARPSVQPYLMSWCRYDPAKEMKKLKIPILIIQGTTDLQVSVDNAQKLKNAKSSATLTIIKGMNHILKDAPPDKEQNLATYKNPDLPLKPELVTAIVDFIKGLE